MPMTLIAPDDLDRGETATAAADETRSVVVLPVEHPDGAAGRVVGFAVVVRGPEALDEATLRAVARRRPAWVSIAIDGADAASHDGYRRVAGGFHNAIGALQTLRNLGVRTRLVTHVGRHNHDAIADLLRLALWFAVERWSITFTPAIDDAGRDALSRSERSVTRATIRSIASAFPHLVVDVDDRSDATAAIDQDGLRPTTQGTSR